MVNIKSFIQYIEDNRNTNRLLYSLITALGVVNSNFFDFLKDNKQRYLLNDNSFWQSLVFELRKRKEIKFTKDNLISIKGISVEKDWLNLKQCLKAAETIKKKFDNIKNLIVKDDKIIINTATKKYLLKNKDLEDEIEENDIEKFLGFTIQNIYENKNWNKLIKNFIKLLKDELKPKYLECLEYFTDNIFENYIELNWDTYRNHKVNGLGVKCEELPKLYYNKLYDYCIDVCNEKAAFRDYKFFYDNLINIKNEVLNKSIIIPLLKKTKNKRKNFNTIIRKKFSIKDEEYYRFDNKMDINKIPAKSQIKYNKANILDEKIWINSKKSLILEMKSDVINMKVLICLSKISPSEIIIKDRYEEI